MINDHKRTIYRRKTSKSSILLFKIWEKKEPKCGRMRTSEAVPTVLPRIQDAKRQQKGYVKGVGKKRVRGRRKE